MFSGSFLCLLISLFSTRLLVNLIPIFIPQGKNIYITNYLTLKFAATPNYRSLYNSFLALP